MKDFYQILEITPDASQDAIKAQYRFLVQAWHPDKFPNSAQKLKAEEKIKEINAAYEILCNPTKRAEYDSRTRYTRTSNEQEYRERTNQHQSEDERRKKEDAVRRAKEEQWQKERATRERAEAEKLRAEDLRKQKIFQIETEISLLNQEIVDLNQQSPKLPSRKIDLFLIFGGLMFFIVGMESISTNYIQLFIGGLLIIIGASLMYIRVNPKKSVLSEIEKRKYRVAQLLREKQNLKHI